MKKKTIVKVIEKKISEWAESIDDIHVRGLVQKNTIVTGGCIASMLLKEPVNDFDIYFTDMKTVEAVAKYYLRRFQEKNPGYEDAYVSVEDERVKVFIKSSGVARESGVGDDNDEDIQETPKEDDGGVKYRPVYISANAITLSGKIQIVLRFYGNPEEIHQHYDYVHCTNYWLSDGSKLVLSQPALEALLARELTYIGSKYPIASMVRTRKFIKRGWTINAGQYLKMAYQVAKLDLTNTSVLEDQLTGVDVAYFMQLIEALKEHKERHPDFELSYGYLAELIDRMF